MGYCSTDKNTVNTHKFLLSLVAVLAIGNVVLLRELTLFSKGADESNYLPAKAAIDLNNVKDAGYGLREINFTTFNDDRTVLQRLDQLERKLDSVYEKISPNTKSDSEELLVVESRMQIDAAFRGASDDNIPAGVAVPPMLQGATLEEVLEQLEDEL